MKKTVLREYARLIVHSGVNVRKGQEVLIYADLDQPEFVQMVVEEAYKAKAKKVSVEWNYQPLQKLHVRHLSANTLGHNSYTESRPWGRFPSGRRPDCSTMWTWFPAAST